MGSKDASSGATGTDTPIELGGYRLVELLGRGGMGEVWRGEREGPGGIRRRAAVKRILPALQNNPTLRERFLAEARINTRLESPNIVQVVDYGESPEPYLVLEYVEGITASELLRELSQTRARLPVVAAAFIAAEVASGLDHAHRKRDEEGRPLNIVHRDVSPQNILISLDGAVKIGDFGVARAADNQFRTQLGMQIGKIGYMPPEQMQGGVIDARADVFSLGVTLWELLTIQPMLPRDDTRAALEMLLGNRIQKPSQVEPRVPATMDAVLMPALAVDPTQRYASAGAFAQALRSFVHSLAPGFDSNELMRILAKLMPAVRFHVPTNTFAPGGGIPAVAASPALSAVAAPVARAPQMMPAMAPPVAQHAAVSPARSALSSSSPALGRPPMPRDEGTLPPLPQSSPWPLLVVAGLLIVVIGGLALGFGLKRSHARATAATDSQPPPVMPNRVPLTQAAPTPIPVVPSTPMVAPDPSAVPTPPDPTPTLNVPAPTPTPTPAPVVPDGPPPRPPVNPAGNTPRGQHGRTDTDRALARLIQSQLAPLRGMVRACLGVREGSGARVNLGVRYDPVQAAVQGVQINTNAVAIGPAERGCVEQTVRDSVHIDPEMAEPGTVWQVYEF